MCARGPDGLGLALKVDDGNTRAVAAALAEVLRRLGFEPRRRARYHAVLTNSRGETVGEIRLARLRRPAVRLEAAHTSVC